MKNSKLFMLFMVLFVFAMPSFAQTAAPATDLKPIGVGLAALAMAIASGLCGLAQANAVKGAAEGIARNPGAGAAIRGIALLTLFLIESMALYTFVIVIIK